MSSILWAIRCSYTAACDIKTVIPDWSNDEVGVNLILYPIFEFFIGAVVLALLISVTRKPVWADAALNPGKHRPEAMGQYPTHTALPPGQPAYPAQPIYPPNGQPHVYQS